MSIKAPVAAKAPVIRTPSGSAYHGIDLKRLLPAWIVSAVMHVVIVLLFLALGLLDVRSKAGDVTITVDPDAATVDEPENNQDLTDTEMGNDPTIPLNFNVDRLADVSVPGVVVPNESIGLPGAPDGPTMSVPPPPGAGRGTGAGRDDGTGPPALTHLGTEGGFYGRMLAGGFDGRSAATKQKMLQEGGGTGASEAAVGLGLRWLALHQGDDGRWSLDNFDRSAHEKPSLSAPHFKCNCGGQGMRNDTAGTAFGVLPFLAAGITPRNQNEMKEDYRKNVESALKFLINHQDPKTGDLGGGMYAHGLASIALCEAYGLTSDQHLKGPAQKAIDFIVSAQDPASGGWRYTPRSGGDTSVVGWQLMAIKSAQMAGLNVPTPTLTGAEKWLNSVQTSNGGGYGYVAPQETPTMSAVGLLCRQYLGWSPRNLGLINGVAYLQKYPPGSINSIYYYYYATQVMHHMGGDAWNGWNGKMRDMLVNSQDQGRAAKKPHQIGSWSPDGDAHGAQGGRIMQTSLSLLTLEVYYRHLPLYRRDVTSGKEMESKQ